MAHPLDPGMVSPPPPNPNAGRGSDFNALTSGNALMMPQPQRQMPVPSHQETVAALRHFMTIIDELQTLEKNPSLGRSDLKGIVIDGFTKLVGERMISAANAVSQLASFPENPLQQRKWVQSMLQQTIKAQNGVVDHHVAGSPATLDWSVESQHAPYNSDNHMATMDGLAGHYRPAPGSA